MKFEVIPQKVSYPPHWVTLLMCTLFAILYGIWLQPNSVFVRHTCLIVGALLSLPIIYSNRKIFLSRKAMPIWLIALLLIWATLHLFLIGLDFHDQWIEYSKAWKKIAIGCVFALGLGLSLSPDASNPTNNRKYWRIIYVGFSLPVAVYFLKLCLTNWASSRGIELPPFLINSRDIFTDPFAIHRSGYVFFTMPALAIGLACLSDQARNKLLSWEASSIYFLVVVATSAIYVIESDRLGLLFSLGLVFISIFRVFQSRSFSIELKRSVPIVLLSLALLFFVGLKLKDNVQWKTFFSDARIAIQVDRYDNWKYPPEYLPTNDMGVKASDSNYKRIAWLIVGSRLAVSNPLGYGLLSQSFGRLCKLKWPESQTSWSHSAWLDFTLGYGFPGALLLFIAAALTALPSKKMDHPWHCMGPWVLGSWIALFMVKELSAEIYINAFIFIIVMIAALKASILFQKPSSSHLTSSLK